MALETTRTSRQRQGSEHAMFVFTEHGAQSVMDPFEDLH